MAGNDLPRRSGVSLAKGPVAIVGVIGIAYGISALILGGHGFALHVPHGPVSGKRWLGLEVNGWSDLLFIAAGGLLLFAAPLHWSAKTMSLLVGLALGAAAVIALIRGNGVFGIFAANHVTELVWAAAAVLLLVLALLPRVGGGRADALGEDRAVVGDEPAAAARPREDPRPAPRRRLVRRESASASERDSVQDSTAAAPVPDAENPDTRQRRTLDA